MCDCDSLIIPVGPPGKDGKNGVDGGGLIVAMKTASGDFSFATDASPGYGTILSYFTSGIAHTIASGDGLYKTEYFLYMLEEIDQTRFRAGLNINGANPTGSFIDFEVAEFSVRKNNNEPFYVSTYTNLQNGDVVYPDFMVTYGAPGSFIALSVVQIVITKVNSCPQGPLLTQYTVVLNQGGAIDPPLETATIKNDILGTWTKDIPLGVYTYTKTGAFPLNKTFITMTNSFRSGTNVMATRLDNNRIQLESSNSLGVNVDDIIDNLFFKIEVYP